MDNLNAVIVRDVWTGKIRTVCRECLGPSDHIEGEALGRKTYTD